jgi:hypothetical protein
MKLVANLVKSVENEEPLRPNCTDLIVLFVFILFNDFTLVPVKEILFEIPTTKLHSFALISFGV